LKSSYADFSQLESVAKHKYGYPSEIATVVNNTHNSKVHCTGVEDRKEYEIGQCYKTLRQIIDCASLSWFVTNTITTFTTTEALFDDFETTMISFDDLVAMSRNDLARSYF
jgi:hypothetical protein